jgi:hypothetical protein
MGISPREGHQSVDRGLEAVHGQRRDKEFKTLSKIVLGNNPATRQAATLTFQYMHNKAHDR